MYRCLLVFACLLGLTQALPGGAPLQACNDFRPRHAGTTEQSDQTPYLTLVDLPFSEELGFFYEPETVYQSKLQSEVFLHLSYVCSTSR